jgi:hypothetical protein
MLEYPEEELADDCMFSVGPYDGSLVKGQQAMVNERNIPGFVAPCSKILVRKVIKTGKGFRVSWKGDLVRLKEFGKSSSMDRILQSERRQSKDAALSVSILGTNPS